MLLALTGSLLLRILSPRPANCACRRANSVPHRSKAGARMVKLRLLAGALCVGLTCGDDAFHARLDAMRSEGGLFHDVMTIEGEAAKYHERLQLRYGRRLRLPATPELLVEAWPKLFGERFEERREHKALLVIVDGAHMVPQFRKVRHVVAGNRLDVAGGAMGFTDDDAGVNAGGKGALGAHRPLLAALFANETWGGRFDWLAFGEVDAGAATRYLSMRDASLAWFLGTPREATCVQDRTTNPFACCANDAAPCGVSVPAHKPYFSFERNGSRLQPQPCRRYRHDGRYASFGFKPCCPVRQRRRVDSDATGFPYRYQPRRGRVHFHALSFDIEGLYFLSRGLLDKATYRWRACADKLTCGSGGKRLSTCIFNLGTHLSQIETPSTLIL